VSTRSPHAYAFGPFRLVPEERLLLRDSQGIHLTPKAFDTLVVLVQNSGRLLPKRELLELIWPDSVVEENNLTQAIAPSGNPWEGPATAPSTSKRCRSRGIASLLRSE